MTVNELHSDLIHHFHTFFKDFDYSKAGGSASYYVQNCSIGEKIIFLNISDYQDGLMIEFILGINHSLIEHQLAELLQSQQSQEQKLSLSVDPSLIDGSLPKRSFLNPHESIHHYTAMMEDFFVKSGFYWLDKYANAKRISDYLVLRLINADSQGLNIKRSSLRSLLLKKELGEPITEDLFYTFLELMQEKSLPETEIKEYLSLRKYFIGI